MKNEGDAIAPGERSPLLFHGPDSPRSAPAPLIRTHPPAAESGIGCPNGLQPMGAPAFQGASGDCRRSCGLGFRRDRREHPKILHPGGPELAGKARTNATGAARGADFSARRKVWL